MSYDDAEYLTFTEPSDAKKVIIEHTTGRWETAKSLFAKVVYVIFIALTVYAFSVIWGWYFWLDFVASIPFAFYIAKKIIRVRLRWFMTMDLSEPKLSFYGVPRTFSWNGKSVSAKDNNSNPIEIVNKIDLNKMLRTVKSTMTYQDITRLNFLQDAKTLDRTLSRYEKVLDHNHYLKHNWYNNMIGALAYMQEHGLQSTLSAILRKNPFDVNEHPSVGKGQGKEVIEDDET